MKQQGHIAYVVYKTIVQSLSSTNVNISNKNKMKQCLQQL